MRWRTDWFLLRVIAFFSLFDLIPSHKDVNSWQQPSICLVGCFFAVYFNNPAQKCLKIMPSGFFPIDDLKFGREFWQSDINILKIHSNDLMQCLKLAIALHASDNQLLAYVDFNNISLFNEIFTLCWKIYFIAPTTLILQS